MDGSRYSNSRTCNNTGSLTWSLVCVFTTLLVLGCQKPAPQPNGSQSANRPGVPSSSDTQRKSAPAEQNDLKSQTADPVSAVKVFLEAVRTGDDEKVIQLFSELAQEQAGKLNRQFAPVGSDTARYEVFDDVEYLAPDGARVKSTWTDLDSQGKPRTDEITWMLRKEADGWRIAGMATVIFEGEPPLLLDFENMPETLRKIELLSQEIERRAAQSQQADQQMNANPADQGTPASAADSQTPAELPAAPVADTPAHTAQEPQPNVLRK